MIKPVMQLRLLCAEIRRKGGDNMNLESKKVFVKPVLMKEERYQTANIEHCHQVKNECFPYQMKA